MIPHSRLLIAVPSSGLAQRAELLAYAALPLLVHERDEEVLDRRLHLTRPGDRSSALGEQPSHTLGVGTARSNDQPQASPHAHDLLDLLHVGQDVGRLAEGRASRPITTPPDVSRLKFLGLPEAVTRAR